jgi:starch-binding outer membrane protein, SusD/RagB family
MHRTVKAVGSGLLALILVTSGCADTEIQGVVLNDDLNTPELMVGLVRGTNSEFGDIFLASDYIWTMDGATDGFTNDGTTAAEVRLTVGDFNNRPQASLWAQSHEAVWAALFTDIRLKDVLPAEDYMSSPLAARVFVYGGQAERILGENFCELIYNYGKDGGILLGKEPSAVYNPRVTVPRDSAFKRAIYMYETALKFATAGVAANRTPVDGDPLFDPARLVIAANAGLAQAYLDLGDYTKAVEFARKVPDNFADLALMDGEVDGGNNTADFFFANDDMSLYRSPAGTIYASDPRVALRKCGDWRSANLDNSSSTPPSSAFTNLSSSCGNAGEFRSESNRYPLWISAKYPDDDADIEIASGAEMRLIEAEAALRAGNLTEFTTQINRARAARGVGPITAPTSAGSLEYPNAQNDGWSILDRERYLELFLEGRRLWDLERWDHPFITNNVVLLPRLQASLPPGGRRSCLPIPQQECTTNSGISCPVLSGT